MNTAPGRIGRTVAALTAAGALTLLAGCSSDSGSDSDASSTVSAGAAACAEPSGPMADAAGEPAVQVPQPANWEPLADQETEIVRLALVNRELASDGFAPNLVVTVVPSQGTFDQIIDNELSQLQQMQADVPDDGEKSTVCGYDAYTITYSASGAQGVPVHPITSRMIVVPAGAGTSNTVVLTVQSTDAENATYRDDSTAMLDGVQIGGTTAQ